MHSEAFEHRSTLDHRVKFSKTMLNTATRTYSTKPDLGILFTIVRKEVVRGCFHMSQGRQGP